MARVPGLGRQLSHGGWRRAGPPEDPGQIGHELGRKSVLILELVGWYTCLEVHGQPSAGGRGPASPRYCLSVEQPLPLVALFMVTHSGGAAGMGWLPGSVRDARVQQRLLSAHYARTRGRAL